MTGSEGRAYATGHRHGNHEAYSVLDGAVELRVEDEVVAEADGAFVGTA